MSRCNLGLLYYPQRLKIDLNQNAKVQVWLTTPSHRINGNDTVTIQWNPIEYKDCFTISPKELSFNIDNLHLLDHKKVKFVHGPKMALMRPRPLVACCDFEISPRNIVLS